MGKPMVPMGSTLQCSFGMAPSTLVALPIHQVLVEGRPAANIGDNAGIVNIPPFGMCTSLANPTVAAATAAALGILTPMPCVPVIPAPWIPTTTTLINNLPALVAGSQCICAYGGIIQVAAPGATKTLA